MRGEEMTKLPLEIAHVLFIDIVGYSKLRINQQSELLRELNEIVSGTSQFREADAQGKLIRLPTGDGMALVFRTNPAAPAQCALEISEALKSHPDIQLRMGIHSGPVSEVADVNQRANIAGAGINIAQRVMDCGDAGHILISKHAAEDLEHYDHLQPHLHELGQCEVKHGERVHVVNLFTNELGNPAVPERFANKIDQQLDKPVPARSGICLRRWIVGILIGTAIVIALVAVRRLHRESAHAAPTSAVDQRSSAVAAMPEKSIAVLPFENLSSDKENAFFAQGIQDEIITTLSKISGLRVISRTSTARYGSQPENLPEIARELRVANVLEGSVQKSGDRVHINVQLIQAETDSHLWAQSYDRQLTDIFSVEGEVAKKIADSLSATLSPQEKARVETKPTENADAYVLYLRARQYQTRPDNFLQDFKSAAELYQQAIAIDPNFALAHARLSAVTSQIYHWFEPTEAHRQKARAEALESLRLQPNLGEGHLAMGVYLYYEEADYEGALRELDLAAQALPNDGDVALYIAAVQRRQGRLTEALAAYERALAIDPRNQITVYDASQTYFGLRDWQNALRGLDRVLALAPDSVNVKIQRGYTEFFWKGSTAPIKAALESIPANLDPDGIVTFARWDVSLMDRDPAAAERALAACRLETITSQPGAPLPKSYLQACIDLARGDNTSAQKNFEAARPAIEKTVSDSPQAATQRAQLGLLYAFMGRKEDALREAQRAVELKPISQDVIEGAVVQSFQALVFARTGESEKAISAIEHLLTTPFAVDYADDSITLSDLRTRWEWDPLRNDPRFQKILAGPEPKMIRK
ncbi:MAG TPA: tetratricopeptide repeat protein [Candidatus Udaeobacter sp.]|nr:tetratricopeptide repeat protein [Candidatus Udaeobacter sp.]